MYSAELCMGAISVAQVYESAGQMSPQVSRVIDHGHRLEAFGGIA